MSDQTGSGQASVSSTNASDHRGWVSRMVEYAEKGAALVYHDVLAIQINATKWSEQNPAIASLLQRGVTYVLSLLAADGLPTRDVWLVATTVEAALKELAANDPTIPSISGVAGPVVTKA